MQNLRPKLHLALPTEEEARAAVSTLLRYIGEQPNREGLQETPQRVIKAMREACTGYNQAPEQILQPFFEETEGYKGLVVLCGIEFTSLCEHHLAPVKGIAHIAYIPHLKVVGLSKLARLVDVFAKRLQLQERMTAQIADSLMNHVDAAGVGVVIEAEHSCLSHRGAEKKGALMQTAAFRGNMEQGEHKQEFWRHIASFTARR
ncbi:MAG: GTP cyclohydrolase I FolE [Alphaproteobacteria bacterium]